MRYRRGVAFIFYVSFYFAFSILGDRLVTNATGYHKGISSRFISVVHFELLRIPFSFFTYHFLLLFLYSYGNTGQWKKQFPAKISPIRQWLIGLLRFIIVIWLILSHVAPFLYYAPANVQFYLFDFTLISLGFWYHLVIILIIFLSVTFLLWILRNSRADVKLYQVEGICHHLNFPIATSIFLAFIISFASFIGSSWIFIKNLEVKVEDLPETANGFKFALLSDLHIGASVNLAQVLKVVEIVKSLDLDAVFIAGDTTDGLVKDIAERVVPLKYLHSKYGTYLVSGNHEYYYDDAMNWLEYFQSIDIIVLNNRAINISGFCLCGVNDLASSGSGIPDHRFEPEVAIKDCDQSSPVLVLSHTPSSAKKIAFNDGYYRVDLILSGHIHAGQFLTIAPIVYWTAPYFYGMYEISSTTRMFVSAGVYYQAPPMKIPYMAEVWIVTLKS